MKIWGYWATLGWAVLAFVVSQLVATLTLVWLGFVDLTTLVTAPFDGAVVAISVFVANPVMIGIVALAIAVLRAPIAEYLALNRPAARDLGLGLACLVVLIAASDASLYFGGYPVVTPFQIESYTTASAQGWAWALWLATVILAPAGEETLFRGFLFRGWVRTPRTVWLAILVI